MIEDQNEAFGAPVLSASTGEETVIEDPTWTPPEPKISRLTENPMLITDPSDDESDSKPTLAKGSIIVITCVIILGLITIIAAIVGLSFHIYRKQAKGRAQR